MPGTLVKKYVFSCAVLPAGLILLVACAQTVLAQEAYQSNSQFDSRPFAVVELFTSEGCSSCPPVDQLLARINTIALAETLPIYPLGFHVDYWDYLGWKDKSSDKKFTVRQKLYAAKQNSSTIYTPQLIVNGTMSLSGLRELLAEQTIKEALVKPAKVLLTLDAVRRGRDIKIQFVARGPLEDTLLNVAVVENQVKRSIKGGENAGRNINYVNVVRVFETYRLKDDKDEINITLPDGLKPEQAMIFAYVQDPRDMRILGANRLEVPNLKQVRSK